MESSCQMKEEPKQTHVALGLRRLNIFDKLIWISPSNPWGIMQITVTGGSFDNIRLSLCLPVSHFLKRRKNVAILASKLMLRISSFNMYFYSNPCHHLHTHTYTHWSLPVGCVCEILSLSLIGSGVCHTHTHISGCILVRSTQTDTHSVSPCI